MKVRLKFHSPSWLNKLEVSVSEQSPEWSVASGAASNPAFIDLDTLQIADAEGANKATLQESFVDEEKHVFSISKKLQTATFQR